MNVFDQSITQTKQNKKAPTLVDSSNRTCTHGLAMSAKELGLFVNSHAIQNKTFSHGPMT
jgi:hypothetical protein